MIVTIKSTEEEQAMIAKAAARMDGTIEMVIATMLRTFTGVPDIVVVNEKPAPASSDLDWLFAETDRVQSELEKVRYVGQSSMDCPECGGGGSVSAGSLGGICVSCEGSGVVDAPFAEPLDLPNMAAFRLKLNDAQQMMLLGGVVNLGELRRELAAATATAKAAAQKALSAAPAETKRIQGHGRARRRLQSPKSLDAMANIDSDEATVNEDNDFDED